MISLLFNANEGDLINIFINSAGGILDTAQAIIEAIKSSQGHIVCILIGACHSAASIISMYCDEIIMDNAYMLIHTASGGTYGTMNNMKTHTEFTVKQVDKLLEQSYKGFLSEQELKNIKHGMEIWLDSDEIKERFESRTELLRQEYENENTPTQEEIPFKV